MVTLSLSFPFEKEEKLQSRMINNLQVRRTRLIVEVVQLHTVHHKFLCNFPTSPLDVCLMKWFWRQELLVLVWHYPFRSCGQLISDSSNLWWGLCLPGGLRNRHCFEKVQSGWWGRWARKTLLSMPTTGLFLSWWSISQVPDRSYLWW